LSYQGYRKYLLGKPPSRQHKIRIIKLTGVFLLISGWIIVLAALAVLPPGAAESGFALAGGAVEAVGAALLFRAHASASGARR